MMQQGVQSTAITNPKPNYNNNKKHLNSHVAVDTHGSSASRNNIPKSLDRYAVGESSSNNQSSMHL